jgi:N-lysine methyltransferase SETD6
MGSRILSRSFQVAKWESERREGEESDGKGHMDPIHTNTSIDSAAMDVDDPQLSSENKLREEDDDEEDDESEDDPADVAMVPMADMLNARFESENVSGLPRKCIMN